MPTPTRLCVLLRANRRVAYETAQSPPRCRRSRRKGHADTPTRSGRTPVPNPTATVRDPPIVATPHGGSDDGGE